MSAKQKRTLIHNALVEGRASDILIRGARIVSVEPASPTLFHSDYDTFVDATHQAAFPGFVNGHTHAAMSLFRGFGDDLPLMEWLTTKIWPNEAHLDEEIIYWGTRLACLEMIKSGTTAFNDMYFFPEQVAQAVRDSGLRAVVCPTTIGNDMESIRLTHSTLEHELMGQNTISEQGDTQVTFATAPHAPYTVGAEALKWIHDFAQEHDIRYHIHLSETEKEFEDSLREHGLTPVEHLDRLGVLGPSTIAAHCVWLSDRDVQLLGSHGVSVVHNPNSNLKLGSGHAFRYSELVAAGANVAIGTDGCSSSNNLDMIEAMKVAALLQKGWRRDTTVLPAREALQTATWNGAKALGIDAGIIAPGMLADIALVDLRNLAFVPNNDTVSNLVYAAHGDCVDTLFCGGRMLMRHRQVEDEECIVEQAQRMVKKLIR